MIRAPARESDRMHRKTGIVTSPDRRPPGRRRLHLAVLVVAVLIAVGAALVVWRGQGRGDDAAPLSRLVERGAAVGFNVLLVTLDTTRPDRLGCYGYGQARTPTIDGLLGNGVLFENAVTSVPLTLPSHASLLTGRYPPALRVRDNGTYRLGPEHETLAEILHRHGYATAAFVSCFVLDRRFGLDQGFDLYELEVNEQGRRQPNELRHERPADEVSRSAIAWLRARSRDGSTGPFFAWVHYFDPHHPYAPPPATAGQIFKGDAYDGEIAFVDRELGRLLAALDELGLRDRTLVVLASDHGEGLGEHGEAYHGIFVYESTIRVALMLSCPALFGGPARVGDALVGLVDVLPTLEDLLGLPPSAGLDGRSLLRGAADPDRTIYIESMHPAEGLGCSALVGLRRAADKYIHAPRPEYYDLAADPGESLNLYDTTAVGPDILHERLAAMLRRFEEAVDGAGARTLSDEERRALQSLGYVSGTYAGPGKLPDPKDRIAAINQMSEVTRLTAGGRYEEALTLAEHVAAQCDGYDAPVHQLAHLHAKLGRHERAVAVLEDYARRHPSTDVFHHLATRLRALGRFEEFERALQAAEAVDVDGRGAVPMLRGDHYFEQGRYAEALEQYERARAMDAQRLGAEIERKIEETRQRLG
jgi:arylsulfatase A-like enzyme